MLLLMGIHTAKVVSEQMEDYRELRERLVVLISVADGTIRRYENKYVSGLITRDEAKRLSLDAIGSLGYDDDKYFFIFDSESNVVSHPHKEQVLNYVEPLVIKNWIAKIVRDGEGFVEYQWRGNIKVSYGVYIENLDWIVGTGTAPSPTRAERAKEIINLSILLAVFFLIVFFLATMLVNSIKDPDAEMITIIKNMKGTKEK